MKTTTVISSLPTQQSVLRVAAYCRVSTDKYDQSLSLENQIRHYTDYISHHPGWAYAGIYSYAGISGSKENRPGFCRMLADARAGKIDKILTKSISRFARNTVTVLKAARELKEYGVGIFFEEQNLDTLTQAGELMLTVYASFAEEELRSLSENMKLSRRRQFAMGNTRQIVHTRFLGYDKDSEGRLTVNEQQAETVRFIFQMALDGHGTKKIAFSLNDKKISTISGRPWQPSTVLYILKNEKYKGDFLLQKTYTPVLSKGSRMNRGSLARWYVEHDHPAIIERDDWERVQRLLRLRNTKPGTVPAGAN